ncbi:ATP-binding protein [Actinoplanes sp. DH11]|uniref:ATP-binding protein n=1 Tax=Actinoplanes sp. DH11 TaxID=2857011 RepID=UPI001E3146AB|nr:ATP-binding protein [Actinoplanes sp. DH11]
MNPFAQAALGAMYDPNAVTITTPAIERALAAVADYLSAPNRSGTGRVLAVTGEHGMGKTHLAKHVIHRAEHSGSAPVRTLYLIAGNRTFVELYKDLVDVLLKQSGSEVPDLVRRIYAGIVAGLLRQSRLGERVADDLDAGLRDPVRVVDDHGLVESDLLDSLENRLRAVTSNRDFSLVLTLMLRPEFESSAREWLLGHPPDSLLRERGLSRTIDSEGMALEAMGVFALLYHHAGVPLLLAIDEIEKILLRPDRPGDEVIGALQQFLEKIAAAGGFLMLVGLPEAIEGLPRPVRDRIGEPIRMAPFTGTDVTAFIADSNPGRQGPAALRPFTPATIDYLVDLVGGIARPIIKIGNRLLRKAADKGVDVTAAMVREALREEYDIDVPRAAHREIENNLSAAAWPYELNHRVGRPGITVDYWVTVAEGAYCAVVITESVLDAAEAEALRGRIEVIRAEPYAVEVILVAVGILPPEWAEQLAAAMNSRPVRFDSRSFGEDFENALRTAVNRLGPPETAAEPGRPAPAAALGRLARQQSNMFRLLGQTTTGLDGFRASSDRQFAKILSLLQELAPPAATPEPLPPALPDDVTELFGRAEAALQRIPQVRTLFDAALRIEDRPAELPFRLDLLRSRTIHRAAGVGFVLQEWLAAFHRSVTQWYAAAVEGAPAAYDWDLLANVCQIFDAVCDELPVLAVDDLADLLGPVPDSSAPAVVDALDRLGSRVQGQMRVSLGAAATSG